MIFVEAALGKRSYLLISISNNTSIINQISSNFYLSKEKENKIMLTNLTKKVAAAAIGLATVLAGMSFVPALTYAEGINGLVNLGIHLGADSNLNANAQGNDGSAELHGNADVALTNSGDNSDQGTLIKGIVKHAQAELKQAITNANSAFKDTKVTAQTQLHTDVTAATSQANKIAAVKTYLSSLWDAIQSRTHAIGVAIEAFISAKFNQAPTADSQNVSVTENSSVNITLTGSDPEGSPLTYIVVSTTNNGTLTGTAPNLTYTPNANFTGTDSFTFKVNDGSLDSTLKTVSITVNPS